MTWSAVRHAAASSCATSISWPSPVRSRCSRAAWTATPMCIEIIGSANPPGCIGSPGKPVTWAMPAACSIPIAQPT